MFKRFFFLSLLAFSLLSCQTIHYVNSGEEGGFGGGGAYYEISKWHHIGVLGLVEYSSPVNIPALCGGGGWKAVRTQTNIAQGAVKHILPGIADAVTKGAGSLLGAAYSPEEVSVSCD